MIIVLYIEYMIDELIELTQELVQQDTTGGWNKDAVHVYEKYLKRHEIPYSLNEYKEGCINLEARIGPKGADAIVISGHLDVVPTGDLEKWAHHPFSGKIVDNELWGRGSVDMKGGCALLAGVMAELKKYEDLLKYEIRLAITAEEEVGLIGAWEFAKGDIMDNTRYLLIAEPTGLDVAIMEKGILWVKIKAVGKQAHGSRPDLGFNAIEGLVQIIPELYKLLPDISIPQVGKSTINIGTIEGGSAPNVVPETAEMVCDIRLTPGVEVETIKNSIQKLLEKYSKDDLKLDVVFENSAPAVISEDTQFGELISKHVSTLTKNETNLGGMYFATDAAAFLSKSLASFVIFGPGSKEYLHQTNERLDLDQFKFAWKAILQSLLELNEINL